MAESEVSMATRENELKYIAQYFLNLCTEHKVTLNELKLVIHAIEKNALNSAVQYYTKSRLNRKKGEIENAKK
jgi:hypothetical protein